MAYGTIKVDNIVFTNGGADQNITVSGLVSSTSGSLTVTGTISGDTVKGNYGSFTNLTGVTTSGTTANFQTITGAVGVYTTSISGATITGTAVRATSITGITVVGTTTVSGATITGTAVQATSITGITIIGTTTVSGATITGTAVQATNITGITVVGTTTVSGATITGTAVQATSITGITIIGTTTVSGATITGTTGNFTQLNAVTISGGISGYAALSSTGQTYSGGQRGGISTLTYATGIAADFSLSNNFQVTLTGNTVFQNPTNIISGQAGCITIIQGSSGNTAGYGSYWHYPGGSGSTPSLTATSGAVDILVYYVRNSTSVAYRLVQDVKA